MKRILLIVSVVALIAIPLLVASAGTIAGPGTKTDRIAPHASHSFDETFIGGEMAQIRVKGYGRTALLVEIYDSDGYLVARGTDATGQCLLTWYPTWTEDHTIVVTNLWPNWQTYFISCN
jgi:hypothetical protein